MKKVMLLYYDAGGGHRAAATALAEVCREQQRPWATTLVNLQELLDPLDIFRKLTSIRLQDIYNLILRKGWTLAATPLLRPMQWVVRLYHRPTVRLLESFWREEQPDVVVSLIPHFNRAICQSLQARPGTPFVTVLTDLADYPPHFWIERQQQYVVCGADRAVAQARDAGLREPCIFRVSGMILHPRFYQHAPVDRHAECALLGLDPNLRTGLVMFGGQGSGAMLEICDHVEQSALDVQMIYICGRNERLAAALRARPRRLPRFVTGFTTEVPSFMRLADFFIGKPGPGSISEALAMKLPVIVQRNWATLPQERFNTEWVTEQGVGLVVPNFKEIVPALERLLAPDAFPGYRERAAGIRNFAVFEIASLLEEILEGSTSQRREQCQPIHFETTGAPHSAS